MNQSWVKSIHTAKTRLHLDEIAYRALLADHANVSSSTMISTVAQYKKVMAAFVAAGYRMDQTPLYTAKWGEASAAQRRKILALWGEKGRNQSGKALTAFIARVSGIANPRKLTKAGTAAVIIALERMRGIQS